MPAHHYRANYYSESILKNCIHNWERLCRALNTAANMYLDVFNKSTFSRKSGLFHGKTGKSRGINLLAFTEFYPSPDYLLKILIALRQTSSTDLLDFIATEFVKANNHNRSHPFFTDAFYEAILQSCFHYDECGKKFLILTAYHTIIDKLLHLFDSETVNALKVDAKALKETLEGGPVIFNLYEIEMQPISPSQN